MPIPVIAILAAGLLSFLWPGNKNHRPPPSGGIFAPHFKSPTQGLVESIPCDTDNCGKMAQKP